MWLASLHPALCLKVSFSPQTAASYFHADEILHKTLKLHCKFTFCLQNGRENWKVTFQFSRLGGKVAPMKKADRWPAFFALMSDTSVRVIILEGAMPRDHRRDDRLPAHDVFADRHIDMDDHENHDPPHAQMVNGVQGLAWPD